jgi:hypothetical protein
MEERILKKGLIVTTISVVFMVLIINLISASIYFANISPVYNLGDMIEADVILSPDGAGPFSLVLTCDNTTLEVYKGAPPEKIQLPLTTLWMKGLTGECYFTGYYLNEQKESITFKISKKLELKLSTTSLFSNPGETINIKGNANKLNGLPVNGDVEIRIPAISESKIYAPVVNGEFNAEYIIPKDTPAGSYRIDVIVIEKTDDEITSEGMEMADLTIFQLASSIDVAVDNPRIDPGSAMNFKPVILDQSGKSIDEEVSVVIKDPDSNSVYESFKNSGETLVYETETNTKAGYYNIEASDGRLTKTKDFYINEKALVDFKIVNDTLYVTNIGNVPYNKSIQIDVSGKTFVRRIDNLLPGETKEYYLSGEDSNYDVSVRDDTNEVSESNIPLTGNAIAVSDTKKSISALANTPIVWILIIILLGAIILFLFRDIFKKKSVAYPKQERPIVRTSSKVINLSPSTKERTSEPRTSSQIIPKIEKEIGDRKLSPVFSYDKPTGYDRPVSQVKKETPSLPPVVIIGEKKESHANIAEQGLVMDGHKSRACVIAIKIKEELTRFSQENFDKALNNAYDKKGALYKNKDFTFIIFSPLVTKTFKNELMAVKTAEKIVSDISEYNRKFNDKILCGIAINSGDIINKIENKKLKFTSLGGLTISAKKLAENANPGEILLTKESYNQAMTEVKADKKEVAGIEAYQVKKVTDYEKNKKFINDFIRREKDTKDNKMSQRSMFSPSKSTNNPLSGILDDSNKNKPEY